MVCYMVYGNMYQRDTRFNARLSFCFFGWLLRKSVIDDKMRAQKCQQAVITKETPVHLPPSFIFISVSRFPCQKGNCLLANGLIKIRILGAFHNKHGHKLEGDIKYCPFVTNCEDMVKY